MWINSSAFLVLEKILSWPLTEFLSQRLCKFCKNSTCSLDLPPDFIYAFLQRTPRPPDCEKVAFQKQFASYFRESRNLVWLLNLLNIFKYFLASINKLTFWKFPTVSGHLRHCLVFVTSCPLPIISRWCVIDIVDLTRLLKCHKCCGLWHHLMFLTQFAINA